MEDRKTGRGKASLPGGVSRMNLVTRVLVITNEKVLIRDHNFTYHFTNCGVSLKNECYVLERVRVPNVLGRSINTTTYTREPKIAGLTFEVQYVK